MVAQSARAVQLPRVFLIPFYLILLSGCLRTTLVVPGFLGGSFVSSKTFSYHVAGPVKRVRGRVVDVLSLEYSRARFVLIPKF